jgi:hypothetical protein
MDRLITAAAWHEPQSLAQALLIVEFQQDNIDWDELARWVMTEGIASDNEIQVFYEKVGRSLPQTAE